MDTTWSAVRKVALSRASSPRRGRRLPSREARVVELGAEVVVVEDEPRTVAAAQPPGDGPEDVRRVARLQHVEPPLATSAEHQPGRREERVGVLQDEAERTASGRVGAVLQQRDALEDLVTGVALALRADDGDVVPRRGQGLALQPDPTVERDGQVLDDDEDSRSCTHVVRDGHTAHPMPS